MSAFSNRVSVITGAASGIGQALALELARRGSDLALCDVDEKGLEETQRRIGSGRDVTCRVVDVADREAVFGFRDEILEKHGRVDAVVNNAGVTVMDTVLDASFEDLEWIVGINFWGVVYGTKAFLPHLVERGDGWVVNVSSVFGMIGVPTQSAYNATKFAVRGFTEALRQELEGTGVTATCVHPGGIRTSIVANARFRQGYDQKMATHEAATKRFARMARTTPEAAATTIADGMERRDPRILIGLDAAVIDRVQRIAPVGYPSLLRGIEKAMTR